MGMSHPHKYVGHYCRGGGINMLIKLMVTLSWLPDVGSEEALHLRHAADPPWALGGRPH